MNSIFPAARKDSIFPTIQRPDPTPMTHRSGTAILASPKPDAAQGLNRLAIAAVDTPKILVVDDDAALAECVSQLLRDAGYRVDIGRDSQEALERIAENPARYGILISDNSMPHLSGSQLIEGVRKAGYQGKVLMYSGSVSPDEEMALKAIGTDAVLRKPFDFKFLVPTIEDLCDHGCADKGAKDCS